MVQLCKCYCFLPIHSIPTPSQGLVLELPKDTAAFPPPSYEKVIGSQFCHKRLIRSVSEFPGKRAFRDLLQTPQVSFGRPYKAEAKFGRKSSYEQAKTHHYGCQLIDDGDFVKNNFLSLEDHAVGSLCTPTLLCVP